MCHPTSPTHRTGISHHAAHRHPTVRAPVRRSATSHATKPADKRALPAEKVLIAGGVILWLQPQRPCGPVPRRKLRHSCSGLSSVRRRSSARPSCARWARRKLSGQPLGATEVGARAG